jgi:anaerobic selenocysteine-containing dehydrogenase
MNIQIDKNLNGALKNKSADEDQWIKTTCYGCPAGTCGMLAHRVKGIVTEVKGNPDCPFSQGRLCAKGHAQIMTAYSVQSVTRPLKRTNPNKGIGVDPGWVEISYDEAISTVAEKLKNCHETDPEGLVVGYSDFSTFPWFIGSMLGSFGSPNLSTASKTFCGNNVHPVLQQVHGGFHAGPDFHHCNYLMLFGSNKGAVSNWAAVSSTLEMSQARQRGMKVVVVDPWCSNGAAVADEWVSIRPGTDGAFLLAMMNVMVNDIGLFDVDFLRNVSNAPYLVRSSDGRYVRHPVTKKPMLWDNSDQSAKCFDNEEIHDAAIEGSYEVHGETCTPSFVLFKEHLSQYTPERAEEITTIPADTIRRIAREFGTAASIGQNIAIDGHSLPLRAACAHWYKGLSAHAGAHESGLIIGMLNTIVGAVDVPGGLLADCVYAHHPEYSENSTWLGKDSGLQEEDGLIAPGKNATYGGNFPAPFPPKEVTEPTTMAGDSLVPAGLYMGSAVSKINVVDPKTFNNAIPHNTQVYVQIVSNDVMNEGNPKLQAEYQKKFGFQVSMVPHIDETAEFADIVLPTQTQLERLDMGANNIPDTMGSTVTDEYCINLRQPVIDKGRKHFVDLWMALIDRVGVLPDFNERVNHLLELEGEWALRIDEVYTHKEITEHWIGALTGGNLSLADVAKTGRISWKKTVKEKYPRVFYTSRIPIYYEYIIGAGEKVKAVTEAMGVEWDISRYKALPHWEPGPGYKTTKSGFDLYAVTFKWPFLTGSFSNFNPWLAELRKVHPYTGTVVLNSKYAEGKGILDGDRIKLSNTAGSSVEGIAKLSECIHPECVGMDHSAGSWAKILPPRTDKASKGSHPGSLFEYDMKNIDSMGGSLDASPKLCITRL